MIRLAGGSIVFICALLWGHGRSECLYRRQRLTAALAAFAEFCGERIASFREPLDTIFASFSNDELGKRGILQILRHDGAPAAMRAVMPELDESDAAVILDFSVKIGMGYGEAQKTLCDHTAAALRESARRQEEALADKTRIYRLLPPLAAASVIILLL